MQRVLKIISPALILLIASWGATGTIASGHLHASVQKTCKYGTKTVTKKVHGKKQKVKVCRNAPKPTATPTPAPTLFSEPSGLALDAQGNVYVTDLKLNHVVKLSPDGQVLATIGSKGEAAGQFDQPWNVTLDASGNLYVAEVPGFNGNFITGAATRRVQKLSPSGQPLLQIIDKAGHFIVPADIAVASNGTIYVSDLGAGRIVQLSSTGAFVREIATSDTYPGGLAIDAQDNLYVVGVSLDTITKLSPTGAVLGTYGKLGSGPGEFNLPQDVALDAAGNMYVTDGANNRVQKLSPTGQPLAQWGSAGHDPGQFLMNGNNLVGIAVDAAGNIYVSDPGNSRVQKLSPSGQVIAVWK